MKQRARIARYRTLREQPLWKLLAADQAPEVIGLLQTLLLDSERCLAASVLHERLQRMLDELKSISFRANCHVPHRPISRIG